jgi:hypothetical protein
LKFNILQQTCGQCRRTVVLQPNSSQLLLQSENPNSFRSSARLDERVLCPPSCLNPLCFANPEDTTLLKQIEYTQHD